MNLRPASARPAFRLLGLFGSVDEACAHGRRIAASDPSSPCAIRLSATHAWYSIPREPFDDITPHQLKVNRNLELHRKVIGASADEFRRHKSELTAGRKPTSINKLRAALGSNAGEAPVDGDGGVEETKSSTTDPSFSTFDPTTTEEEEPTTPGGDDGDDDDGESLLLQSLLQKVTAAATAAGDDAAAEGGVVDGRIAVAPLTRDAEVRNQRYAVVSVLLDYESLRDGVAAVEPGLCVWAAFDTEAEALLYAKKVAAKELPDHDVAVVTMYDWVYPHLMTSDKIPYVYRNAELNAIMKHARSSKKQVDDFGKECTARGVAVPVRDIEPDLTEPAPVRYTPHADILEVIDGDAAPLQ